MPRTVLGTPAYVSPEQAQGDGPVDGRSDVYSLACMAYEMICGYPPFIGNSPSDGAASSHIRYTSAAVLPASGRSARALRGGVPRARQAAGGPVRHARSIRRRDARRGLRRRNDVRPDTE